MNRRIVALTGISGVGKSTLIKNLAASVPLQHVQASSLIKEGRLVSDERTIMQDQLRLLDVDENQRFLVAGFRLKVNTSTRLVILDSHTVIETDAGLTHIDPRVFGEIGIDSMIFVADDPEAIAKRRRNDTTRKRPATSVDDLRSIQEEAQNQAATICRALGIPQHIFHFDQAVLIAQWLQQYCKEL